LIIQALTNEWRAKAVNGGDKPSKGRKKKLRHYSEYLQRHVLVPRENRNFFKNILFYSSEFKRGKRIAQRLDAMATTTDSADQIQKTPFVKELAASGKLGT
jgi:hypothetical protein